MKIEDQPLSFRTSCRRQPADGRHGGGEPARPVELPRPAGNVSALCTTEREDFDRQLVYHLPDKYTKYIYYAGHV